jgi:hypothetical protein
MRLIAGGAAIFCLLTACTGSSKVPPPDTTLVQIYCDLALLAGDEGPAASDSTRSAVLERYGHTQESFEVALQPYHADPRRWIGFFQAVADTIEARIAPRSSPPAR